MDQTLSEQDLRYRREIRGNVTQALASLSVYSLQDAAQISLALAQSTVGNLTIYTDGVCAIKAWQKDPQTIQISPRCLNAPVCCLLQAVPSEVVCEGCQENVLESVGRMIRVMEEQTGLEDDAAIDTGRNILHVIGTVSTSEWDRRLEMQG